MNFNLHNMSYNNIRSLALQKVETHYTWPRGGVDFISCDEKINEYK